MEMQISLFVRIVEGIFGILIFSLVVSGFNSSFRPRDYDFLFALGVLALILAVLRGYYVNIKKIQAPIHYLYIILDIVMLCLTIAAVSCALTSNVITSCKNDATFGYLKCNYIYAAIGFTYGLMLVYIVSFLISYTNYREAIQKNLPSKWEFPLTNIQFWLRLSECIISSIAIGACIGIVVGSPNPELGPFTMILAISSLSLIIFFVWIVLCDLPKGKEKILIHASYEVFLLFSLVILSFVAAIQSSQNNQLKHCSTLSNSLNCGPMVCSVVMIWFLFFILTAHILIIILQKKKDLLFTGPVHEIQDPTNLSWIGILRGFSALTGFISFSLGIAAFEQLQFQGSAKLLVSSGYLAFVIEGFLLLRLHYWLTPIPHALLKLHLEFILVLLALITIILVQQSDSINHCSSYYFNAPDFNCHAYIAALAFHYLLFISLSIILIFTLFKYNEIPNIKIYDTKGFLFRNTQIIGSIIMFSTCASSISGNWPREIQLFVGVGVITTFCSYVWLVKHHLFGKKVTFAIVPLSFDCTMAILVFIASIVLVTSDTLKNCIGDMNISCNLIYNASFFGFFTFITYLFNIAHDIFTYNQELYGNSSSPSSSVNENAAEIQNEENISTSPALTTGNYQQMNAGAATPEISKSQTPVSREEETASV